MLDDLEVQVARTAALALHAHALLERTRRGPSTPTRPANLQRLERAVASAQVVLLDLAGARGALAGR